MSQILIPEDRKLCECGKCQVIISKRDPNGRKRRFAKGHNAVLRLGDKGSHWRGGRRTDTQGYEYVVCRGHHFADSNGYVLEHRLVWEQHNNAILLPWGHVHHINHIRNDNSIDNLEAMMNDQHSRLHHVKTK